jgi:hypothetical protein
MVVDGTDEVPRAEPGSIDRSTRLLFSRVECRLAHFNKGEDHVQSRPA